MKNANTPTRAVTPETASLIEESAISLKNISSLLWIVQHSFLDPNGAPEPNESADALAAICDLISRISEDLDGAVDQILSGPLSVSEEGHTL